MNLLVPWRYLEAEDGAAFVHALDVEAEKLGGFALFHALPHEFRDALLFFRQFPCHSLSVLFIAPSIPRREGWPCRSSKKTRQRPDTRRGPRCLAACRNGPEAGWRAARHALWRLPRWRTGLGPDRFPRWRDRCSSRECCPWRGRWPWLWSAGSRRPWRRNRRRGLSWRPARGLTLY